MQTVLPFTVRCKSSRYFRITANESEVSSLLPRWRKRWIGLWYKNRKVKAIRYSIQSAFLSQVKEVFIFTPCFTIVKSLVDSCKQPTLMAYNILLRRRIVQIINFNTFPITFKPKAKKTRLKCNFKFIKTKQNE